MKFSVNKIILKQLSSFCLLIFIFSIQVFAGKTITICKDDGVIFYNEPKGSSPPDIVVWTIEGGSISSTNKDTTDPVFYNTAGTFRTYNVSTYTSTSQVFYDTFIVIVRDWPMPAFYFPKDTGYCAGVAFSLTLNTITFPGLRYEWSTGENKQSIIVSSIGKYWVKLTINSDNATRTCDSVYKEVNIIEYPTPIVNLGPDQLMCQSQIIMLDAKGNGTDKYLWTPNGETTKRINVSLPGIYTVEISTTNNCKATDEIELIDSCPHLIYIPNAVSPNADLLNDVFEKSWNFTPKEYTFSIYNRWGQLLFETNDMAKPWDCKENGEPVQQDVYVYKIIFLDTDKKWYEYRGTLSVIR